MTVLVTGGGEATWHGRPAYSVLGSERADAIELPDWRQGVLEHLREAGRTPV